MLSNVRPGPNDWTRLLFQRNGRNGEGSPQTMETRFGSWQRIGMHRSELGATSQSLWQRHVEKARPVTTTVVVMFHQTRQQPLWG